MSSINRSSSLPDLRHLKALRSNSSLTVPRKGGSPWLTLIQDDGGCVLYKPDEGKIKKSLGDFSGTRFLASYGKWLLMLDLTTSSIYMIDVFRGKRINLPPLESLVSCTSSLRRVEGSDREFIWDYPDGYHCKLTTNDLRGRFWVDDKAEEFLVVWYFDCPPRYLFFCKKGDRGYSVIPLRDEGVPKLYNGLIDLALWGYRIYMVTTRSYIRVMDVSGQQGFKDVTGNPPRVMRSPFGAERCCNIAVTTAGELLLVDSTVRNVENGRRFGLYKMDPEAAPYDTYADLLTVDSLGDEALFLDLGVTLPANPTLGIEPNSIYFTQHYRPGLRVPYKLDVCVYNLATKTFKRFPDLDNFNLKDARWFLPVA